MTDLNSCRDSLTILRWIKQRKAELAELEKQHRGRIEEELGDSDTGELDGKPVVSWKTYKKRQLDQAALKEDHPELVESYVKLQEVRRFEVLSDD